MNRFPWFVFFITLVAGAVWLGVVIFFVPASVLTLWKYPSRLEYYVFIVFFTAILVFWGFLLLSLNKLPTYLKKRKESKKKGL